MTIPLTAVPRTLARLLVVALPALALCACSALHPSVVPSTAFYALQNAKVAPSDPTAAQTATTPLTLIISPVRAASGYDSQRIIYVREAHKLEYFARSEWVDTPARMLGPLLVDAIEKVGAFRAVALTPASATGDVRLDTVIERIQQDFQTRPSRVHFTLRSYLVDEKTRRVMAWREFEGEAEAPSDDPYGGVLAANLAVSRVLVELAQFLKSSVK
jgi:cholesterol transport system auxiliary component